MKFVLATWGSRGDIEPSLAVGRELVGRGHDVTMAVPPDLVGFTEAAGPKAVAFGPNSRAILDAHREFWTCFFRNPWKLRQLIDSRVEIAGPLLRGWQEMSTTLMSLSDGADLIFTGINFEDAAANVAEHYDIPLATLHYFPLRPNAQILTFLPARMRRAAVAAFWWVSWRGTKKVEDTQRRELGLPRSTGSAPRRITERGSLEIQAYDEACFPGLAAEWAEYRWQRPFVGTLTLELATDSDQEIASWIAEGTPPIFFGFGSIPVESPADTIAMISAACARLGERALIGAAGTDFSNVSHPEHVKVVGTMNYAT
ncbi:glycosyltransferase, partial [Micromonospora sp. WMMD736]|uniref:glycosyltransferase n=1 Tax=Micromonospora sp. WMMD736 TaxID=3404112 RepID=UPI003B93AF71